MAVQIRPGTLAAFQDSMAEAIEEELDALMQAGGAPPMNKDVNDQSVRDRRRFLIAIARGVARHLRDRRAAIKVFCEHNQTKPVTVFDVDFN